MQSKKTNLSLIFTTLLVSIAFASNPTTVPTTSETTKDFSTALGDQVKKTTSTKTVAKTQTKKTTKKKNKSTATQSTKKVSQSKTAIAKSKAVVPVKPPAPTTAQTPVKPAVKTTNPAPGKTTEVTQPTAPTTSLPDKKIETTAVVPLSTGSTSTTETPAPEKTEFVTWNLSTDATYSQSAEAPEKGPLPKSITYSFIPLLTTGPIRSIVWLQYNQDLNNDNDSEWQDVPVVFTVPKAYDAGKYIQLQPAISVTIPQTRATKDDAQLNYSGNVNTIIGLNTANLGLPQMLLNWQTGYTSMNNDFTTSAKGEAITAYRFRQRINFWYGFTDNLFWKSRLQFDSNFSYENVVRNAFLHFELLEYRFGEGTYYTQLGHTNLGPTFSGSNYEDNFKFYDSDGSSYFLCLGADF